MDKLKGYLVPGKNRILLFDTEQATFQVQKGYHRTLQTAGVTSADNLEVYCLRTHDTKTRLDLVQHIIYNTPNLSVIMIDGIRDLVFDINSAEEAAMITNKLLKWSEELGVHIIVILHQNKADNNARGHVGTELMNKAESVLSVAKDSQDQNLSIVSAEYFRGQEFDPFGFRINDLGLPQVFEGYIPKKIEYPGKEKKMGVIIEDRIHLEKLRQVFAAIEFPGYNDAWRQVKNSMADIKQISDNEAKSFLRYYQMKGWVGKIDPPHSGKKWAVYQLVQVSGL